jgi:hypothetical protein
MPRPITVAPSLGIIHRVGEHMRLGAGRRERRIEIEHHGALFQRISERIELLTAERLLP